MSRILWPMTVAATALLALSPAIAQPGATLPSPPVPASPAHVPPTAQDKDHDSHVSTHDGPAAAAAGERDDRRFRTNIASNPVGWYFGFYGISVSHAVQDHAAIRADANLFSWDEEGSHPEKTRGYEVGLSVPLYARRVFSGPFIEPGFVIRELVHDCHQCPEHDDFGGEVAPPHDLHDRVLYVGPEVLLGWHWTEETGINFTLAAGPLFNVHNPLRSYDPQFNGYVRIGYAF